MINCSILGKLTRCHFIILLYVSYDHIYIIFIESRGIEALVIHSLDLFLTDLQLKAVRLGVGTAGIYKHVEMYVTLEPRPD